MLYELEYLLVEIRMLEDEGKRIKDAYMDVEAN